jgi:predicted NodU family carbamoyl transferase
VQAMYEGAFFTLFPSFQKTYGLTELGLAGGWAVKSVANGKARRMTLCQRVYVQAAAGGAIGAALRSAPTSAASDPS